MTTTKELVEARFGRTISDDEYEAALWYATMKLEAQSRILDKRFDDEYLTIVTAEVVGQNRLDAYYAEISALGEMATSKGCGSRDGNLVSRDENDFQINSHALYYSTVPTTMQ